MTTPSFTFEHTSSAVAQRIFNTTVSLALAVTRVSLHAIGIQNREIAAGRVPQRLHMEDGQPASRGVAVGVSMAIGPSVWFRQRDYPYYLLHVHRGGPES